jgi:guanylate kinase
VLDIDIEGARQIREKLPHSLQVFVLPPSAAVLVDRLRGRNTENPELLRKRLRRASDELAAVAEYDYAVINEDLEAAVGHVSDILDGKADEWLVSRQADLPVRIERLRRDVIKAAEKI